MVPGGFLTDCNIDSLKIVNGYVDASLKDAKVYDKFQFERIGFFSVDPDTNLNKVSHLLNDINHSYNFDENLYLFFSVGI